MSESEQDEQQMNYTTYVAIDESCPFPSKVHVYRDQSKKTRTYVPERTCRNVAEQPDDGTFWPVPHFTCSECGHRHVSMSYVYFCPNCSARVIDE